MAQSTGQYRKILVTIVTVVTALTVVTVVTIMTVFKKNKEEGRHLWQKENCKQKNCNEKQFGLI